MRTLTLALAAGLSLVAAAKPAEDPAVKKAREARLKEIEKEVGSCSATYGTFTAVFKRKWTTDVNSTTGLSQAELDAISDKYIALTKERLSLSPRGNWWMDLGDAYLYRGWYEKALAAYTTATNSWGASYVHKDFVHSMYGIANCQYALGQVDAARATLDDAATRRYPNLWWTRYEIPWWWWLNSARAWIGGGSVTNMKLPVHTGAKPFPTPRKATYTDTFRPLEKVLIRLSGVDADDARVGLLKTKLEARGIPAETQGLIGSVFGLGGGYPVELALDDKSKVEHEEGYTLDIGQDGAKVAARDLQGVLWGVVSFIQCLNDAEKSVRLCSVEDWPGCRRRGFLGGFGRNDVEFMLFNKMNSVSDQGDACPWVVGYYAPLNVMMIKEKVKQMKAFGFEYYSGWKSFSMDVQFAYTWPCALAMRIEEACRLAALGANIYYPNDDFRYPIHPDDKKSGLNASDFDAPHLAALYKAVKEKYPDFKMIYCPPYYWGPDSGASYPDDREKYLKSLRILPPEVELYWTGAQVKGYDKKPYQVKWFTEMTGHKPTIFQNASCPHNLYGYVADEIDWNGWHYPGFFEDDIAGFHQNGASYAHLSGLAACLWNPPAYDKHADSARGVDQLYGEGAFELLAPGVKALAYFDKYKWGQLNADILHEDLKDLQAKYDFASNCWAKAVAKCPRVKGADRYEAGLDFAKRVIAGAKNPPDFLAKFKDSIGPAREKAMKETNFDKSKGDLLYLPTDMTNPSISDCGSRKTKERRFVKILRAAGTPFAGMSFSFECDPFPPTGDYTLYLYGMDDEVLSQNTLEVVVNGKTVVRAEKAFPNEEYALRTFTIPFASMKRQNQVTIRNAERGDNLVGPPYICIAYAVLKKSAK